MFKKKPQVEEEAVQLISIEDLELTLAGFHGDHVAPNIERLDNVDLRLEVLESRIGQEEEKSPYKDSLRLGLHEILQTFPSHIVTVLLAIIVSAVFGEEVANFIRGILL